MYTKTNILYGKDHKTWSFCTIYTYTLVCCFCLITVLLNVYSNCVVYLYATVNIFFKKREMLHTRKQTSVIKLLHKPGKTLINLYLQIKLVWSKQCNIWMMFSFPNYPFNITFIFNKLNYSNMAIHTSCGNKNKHIYKEMLTYLLTSSPAWEIRRQGLWEGRRGRCGRGL